MTGAGISGQETCKLHAPEQHGISSNESQLTPRNRG